MIRINFAHSIALVVNMFLQRRTKIFALLIPAVLGALLVSPAYSEINLDANPPLTGDDISLRDWIVSLFKTIKPHDEHRMFLSLSQQDVNYQSECRYLRQPDGSVDVLPELTADPDAKIQAFESWHLRFDANAEIGIYNELYFEEIVLMHQGSRVYFSNIPGMTMGASRFVNYNNDVDVLWKKGGYGLITPTEQKEAIDQFHPQSKRSFILTYLQDGERESGFICSASHDVNIYAENERLYEPSRMKQMGF